MDPHHHLSQLAVFAALGSICCVGETFIPVNWLHICCHFVILLEFNLCHGLSYCSKYSPLAMHLQRGVQSALCIPTTTIQVYLLYICCMGELFALIGYTLAA